MIRYGIIQYIMKVTTIQIECNERKKAKRVYSQQHQLHYQTIRPGLPGKNQQELPETK